MAVRGVDNGDDFRSAGLDQPRIRRSFGKAAFALTVSAAAIAITAPAFAQETPLPGIDVQGAKAKKTSAAKSKPKPKPPQPTEAQSAPPPTATNGGNQAAKIDAPYSTPAAVSVAGQGEIQTFGQTNLQDVLRSMPGVSTGNDPNNPGIAVNIRGFEGNGQVNMTIDGVRQSFRFNDHTATGFVYVDPLLLASIEVQRGAVSTAGGAGALAGTADMRTLDVDDVLKPGKDYGALVLSSWGSNGVGFSEMGAGAVRSGAVSVVGAISKHDVDDYDNGLGQRVPFTDQDLISGLAKVHIDIDSTQRLSFGTVLYNNDFTASSYNQNIDSKIYTANYEYKPGNDLVDFRANFYGSDLTMKYDSPADGLTPAQGFASAGRRIEDVGLGFDVQNTSLFDIAGIHAKSNYGYEYFHDDVDSSNKIDPTLKAGPNPSGDSTIRGAFSETTFSKSIFDLVVGLRYDDYNINGSGTVLTPEIPGFLQPFLPPGYQPAMPPGVQVGPYKIDKTEGDFSPKLTLAIKPVEWFQPYVTWSKSFSAPTVSETLMGGVHPGADGLNFEPNPFLEPEKQRGWEFGFNSKVNGLFQAGDQFRFKGDYFTMDVDNYITATCDMFGITCFYVNNPGTSRVEGVELQGTYDVGYAFGGLSYTHNDTNLPSKLDGLGLHSYLPGDSATITGGLRFFDQRLTVGARAYITGKSQSGEINQEFYGVPNFYDGYTTYDLFSDYKLTKDIDVALTVSNLTDVAYTPALTGQPTGNAPEETGRGRTFLLTTKAQF